MFLALILAASPLADANHEYSELNYEACVTKLSRISSLAPKDRAAGELLLGLCLFALGQETKARTHIEAALRKNSSLRTPASASPKEKEFVDELRASAADPTRQKKTVRKDPPPKPEPVPDAPVVAEPAPAPVAETAPPPVVAEPPRDMTPPPMPPAVAAALPTVELPPAPPKAKWLPIVTGGIAIAAGGTGLGLGISARTLETQGRAEPIQVEAARLQREGQTQAMGANIAFAVAGTAAVATVITWLVTR